MIARSTIPSVKMGVVASNRGKITTACEYAYIIYLFIVLFIYIRVYIYVCVQRLYIEREGETDKERKKASKEERDKERERECYQPQGIRYTVPAITKSKLANSTHLHRRTILYYQILPVYSITPDCVGFQWVPCGFSDLLPHQHPNNGRVAFPLRQRKSNPGRKSKSGSGT
jgi:hypothetical protein